MSFPEPSLLLVGSDEAAAELSRLAPGRVAHQTDPYLAMEELGRRAYSAVVLMHPQAELPSLVRALRKLGVRHVFALCSPAGEADLQLLQPEGLEDYFLYPPAPQDIQRMISPLPAGGGPQPGTLEPDAMVELIQSADGLESLLACAARQVEALLGQPVQWVDASAEGASGQAPLLICGEGPRNLVCPQPLTLSADQSQRLSAMQRVLEPLAQQARRAQTLYRLAVTDHLTGAYNRRYFYHFTDQLLQRANQERFRVTLLLYDIDDFKSYNETYGHAVGDEILRQMTDLMRQATRRNDIVARIGGDEFAVLFWDAEPPRKPDSTHPQTAQQVARRFVQALRKHSFASLGPKAKGQLTISGGLASFPWDGKSCRELLRHADGALRQAKRSGKNAIYIIGQGAMTDMEE
jgi:diguanylate cyclase (GGDEF)-like protein